MILKSNIIISLNISNNYGCSIIFFFLILEELQFNNSTKYMCLLNALMKKSKSNKKNKNKNKNQCAKVKARTHGFLEISMKILKTFDSFNDFSIHVGVGLQCTKQDIAIGIQNQCYEYRFETHFGLFIGMKYFGISLFQHTILRCFGLPILYILPCIYIYIYILFYI